MPFKRGSSRDDLRDTGARAQVSSALRSLDAFSFWVVPSREANRDDLIVVGTTGTFLVMPCGLGGALMFGAAGPSVGGASVPDLRCLKRGAKALRSTLNAAAVFSSVEPVVCFTHAVSGPPRTVRGVRYLHVKDVARDLSSRPSSLPRGRAQRAARTLGMHIAGDEGRHFSAR
jgi:hypothetical protein